MKHFLTTDSSHLALPFCSSTAGKDMELVCRTNKTGSNALFTVSGTVFEYSIPNEGRFYYVSCEGAFVHGFSTLSCSDDTVIIRTGRHYCRLNVDRGTKFWEDREPVSGSFFALGTDGSFLVGGHRVPLSSTSSPVVCVRDGVCINSRGRVVMAPNDLRYRINKRIITAAAGGELCITDHRKILCRGMLTLEECSQAISALVCDHGYLILSKNAEVWFSSNGEGWQLLSEEACAIAAKHDLIAYADIDGNVHVYRDGKQGLNRCALLHFPGKHVSEMDISRKFLALKFSDCTFDIFDHHSGKSVLGTRFLPPDI